MKKKRDQDTEAFKKFGTNAKVERQSSGFGLPDAEVQSVNLAFAFGGGYSFEFGIILDRKGNSKLFLSKGPTIGYGLSLGGNVKEIRAVRGTKFNLNDYEGLYCWIRCVWGRIFWK